MVTVLHLVDPSILANWTSPFEPPHGKTKKLMCAPNKESDQPGHPLSDQSLRYPHEETLGLKLPIVCTVKTLIRLGGCSGWSESLLGKTDQTPAKTQIRLGGCPGWSESLLGTLSFCWFCHTVAYLLIVSEGVSDLKYFYYFVRNFIQFVEAKFCSVWSVQSLLIWNKALPSV